MSSAIRYEDEDLTVHVWDSLYIWLVPLPAALLGVALVADILYWVTTGSVYARASEWLLAAALGTGALTAAEGLIRYVVAGSVRPTRACWIHVSGNLFALLLSASNLVYRLNEDARNSVLPAGITLTAVVVCLLIGTAYLGHNPCEKRKSVSRRNAGFQRRSGIVSAGALSESDSLQEIHDDALSDRADGNLQKVSRLQCLPPEGRYR